MRITNKSQEISIQIVFISIVMYFNTFILQLFVYANIDGFTLQDTLKNTFIEQFIPSTQYISMTRNWFSSVGSGIIFTMIIKIINPALMVFFLTIIKKYFFFLLHHNYYNFIF